MRATRKRQFLRKRLRTGNVVRLFGAHNAWGARLVQEAGFDAIWASGLEISTAHGVRDDSILSMSDMLRDAYAMDCASDLPVIADCDSGFGSVANVSHMAREYDRQGIAGVCIEDQVFPKTNSLKGSAHVLANVDDFVNKIRAAKESQLDPEFVVIARVEAFIAGQGLDEAIRRATIYAEAGADAVVIHSRKNDASEIEAFMHTWRGTKPVIVIPTTYPQVTIEYLDQLGVRAVIYANQALRAAIAGLRSVLARVAADGSTAGVEDSIAPLPEVFKLQERERWCSELK